MAEFSLLSLNTFGLPLFLGLGRLRRLSRQLDEFQSAVLCFQEIQQNTYVSFLNRWLPAHPHHAFEPNFFAPKGGLFTAARLPLRESYFVPYENRGRWLSVGIADWALNKGVLVSQLEVEGQRIVVMNTHLHANYGGRWHPENPTSRIQLDQVLHLAAMVQEQPTDALVLVCGDFNFPRDSFLYDELLSTSELLDPLAQDPRPTYRPFPLMNKEKFAQPIDFVLMRKPSERTIDIQADIVEIQDASRAFAPQRFLTDHNALTVKIRW